MHWEDKMKKNPCLVKRPVLSGCPRFQFFLFTSWGVCLLSSCSSVLQPCAFKFTMAHISEVAWVKPYRGRQLSSSMYQQPLFLPLLARTFCRMPLAFSPFLQDVWNCHRSQWDSHSTSTFLPFLWVCFSEAINTSGLSPKKLQKKKDNQKTKPKAIQNRKNGFSDSLKKAD